MPRLTLSRHRHAARRRALGLAGQLALLGLAAAPALAADPARIAEDTAALRSLMARAESAEGTLGGTAVTLRYGQGWRVQPVLRAEDHSLYGYRVVLPDPEIEIAGLVRMALGPTEIDVYPGETDDQWLMVRHGPLDATLTLDDGRVLTLSAAAHDSRALVNRSDGAMIRGVENLEALVLASDTGERLASVGRVDLRRIAVPSGQDGTRQDLQAELTATDILVPSRDGGEPILRAARVALTSRLGGVDLAQLEGVRALARTLTTGEGADAHDPGADPAGAADPGAADPGAADAGAEGAGAEGTGAEGTGADDAGAATDDATASVPPGLQQARAVLAAIDRDGFPLSAADLVLEGNDLAVRYPGPGQDGWLAESASLDLRARGLRQAMTRLSLGWHHQGLRLAGPADGDTVRRILLPHGGDLVLDVDGIDNQAVREAVAAALAPTADGANPMEMALGLAFPLPFEAPALRLGEIGYRNSVTDVRGAGTLPLSGVGTVPGEITLIARGLDTLALRLEEGDVVADIGDHMAATLAGITQIIAAAGDMALEADGHPVRVYRLGFAPDWSTITVNGTDLQRLADAILVRAFAPPDTSAQE